MVEFFTLLFLSQPLPNLPQIQILPYKDVSIDMEVADFLHHAEQQVTPRVLDKVYSFASASLAAHKHQ